MEEEEDIDYSDVFGLAPPSATTTAYDVPLIAMDLPDDVDCEQTRADYQTTEKVNALKLVATFIGVALWAEHHEPFERGEFCFAERVPETTDDDAQTQYIDGEIGAVMSDRVPPFHVE